MGRIADEGTLNDTGYPIQHECNYKDRWKDYFEWKEKVIDFMAEKRTTNGNLKLEDKKLETRLTGLENKIWSLIVGLLIIFVTVLIK
jgi:hypothetical protein